MKFGFNIHREEAARVEVEAETAEEAAEQIALAIEEGRDDWDGWDFLRYEAWEDESGEMMVGCSTWEGVMRLF